MKSIISIRQERPNGGWVVKSREGDGTVLVFRIFGAHDGKPKVLRVFWRGVGGIMSYRRRITDIDRPLPEDVPA